MEKRMKGKNNSQNVVVNVTAPTVDTQPKPSAEKQIITLAQSESLLTLNQIIAKTSIEMDEAEEAIKKLVEKGIAKEVTDATGKKQYDFS
jgi:Fic family protein